MKSLIFLFLLLGVGSNLLGQNILEANLVLGERENDLAVLIIKVDNSQSIKQIFIEAGSSEGINDQLDEIFFHTPQGGQHQFYLLPGDRIMIKLTNLSVSTSHFFQLRLEDHNGQIGPSFPYQYNQ